jgi:hypothetical protein
MDKTKIVILLIIVLIIALGLIYTLTSQKIGPGTPSQGFVEKAWEYCGQFDNTDCNSNKFLDTTQRPAPVNCYWNIKTNNCDAGIGYQ